MFRALQGFGFSNLTATAGTAITALLPPRARAFTRLTKLLYRCGATAHTVTVLKTLGSTTLSAAAAGSQAVINLTADPGTGTPAGAIAANDFVCVQLDSGEFFLGKVSSVSTLAITLTANLPSAAAAGNAVWFFGAPGDHTSSQTTTKPNPAVGSQYPATASILNTWDDVASGLHQTLNQNEPLLVHSNNATAAGTFEQVTGSHTMN